MEERTDTPIAVKVEGHSRSVILTYFQGDINSMVDAHFTRALSKACKSKEPSVKTKKMYKTNKKDDTNTSQGGAAVSYPQSQVTSASGRMLTLTSADNSSWPPLGARAGEAPGLSSIMCSLSSEGLSLTGQQYATSLLNLLHSDRVEMGPSMASSSKPDTHSRWTLQPAFRESVDPSLNFDPGRHVDKKDLYWY
ncbi:transcription cofactor vestigial-like protein 1 [Cololabis saira]|uniref:transcription cofactor vestigial-like protein 1 n=1 Tax=Cololabis saira TaxID=129043 RepID=UPI002AD56044|nr:transcription cofactor vestigial-like protein 1 [Cololabis saira]